MAGYGAAGAAFTCTKAIFDAAAAGIAWQAEKDNIQCQKDMAWNHYYHMVGIIAARKDTATKAVKLNAKKLKAFDELDKANKKKEVVDSVLAEQGKLQRSRKLNYRRLREFLASRQRYHTGRTV